MSVLKKFKQLARSKLRYPIHLCVGDSISVTHTDENGEKILCHTTVAEEHSMTVDEALIFAAEYEGRRALGGMVLEQKK
jgi:hypothetical protein